MANKSTLNPTPQDQAIRDIERCKRILIKLDSKSLTKERRDSLENEYKRRKASLNKFKDSIESLK